MSACLVAILTLNTMVFLYNMNPIIPSDTQDFVDVSPSSFETNLNETGITEQSSGLSAILGIGKFFINIFVLFIGWYPKFSPIINLLIKLGVYTFGIPLFITILRMIRGN